MNKEGTLLQLAENIKSLANQMLEEVSAPIEECGMSGKTLQ